MLSPALDHQAIAGLIPHSGAMCLLSRALEWDDESIHCIATSHRDARNPLLSNGVLSSVCGVEYAAQAMAVHGALLARRHSGTAPIKPRPGMIASLRDVSLHVPALHDIGEDLQIHASRLMGSESNIIYAFTIKAGARLLLEGRATVVLAAEGLI